MDDPILSDDEIHALNAARHVLVLYAKRCYDKGWGTPSGYNDGEPNAMDYGAVQAAAAAAADAIFAVLNWTNAHRIRLLTDEQISGKPAVPDAA